MSRPLRLAIAHDYLTQRGGAERVVLALAKGFPDAPIHTALYEPAATFPEFQHLNVVSSPLNAVSALRRDHRKALPLLPWAASRMKIDADVVIASSSGWAHGFASNSKTLVYCYSPARWLYQPNVYLPEGAGASVRYALKALSRPLQRWDRRHATKADRYLAISSVVQRRIRDTYGLNSEVVPAPLSDKLREVRSEPVDHPFMAKAGYFLCVSRLLPYKNVDKIVEAFRALPGARLVVVGRGPEWANLTRALPPNVEFVQDLTDGQMRTVYDGARALVAASYEDYGLTPLEAALMGKPSVVLRAGGFLDTMVEDETAVFFDSPEPSAIADGVRRLLDRRWSQAALRAHADRFTEKEFVATIASHVNELANRKTSQPA